MTDGRLQKMIDATEHRFAVAARSNGATITGDGRVSHEVAAALLAVPAETLRKWRAAGDGPVPYTLGRLVTYRLSDLASWVEMGRGHKR